MKFINIIFAITILALAAMSLEPLPGSLARQALNGHGQLRAKRDLGTLVTERKEKKGSGKPKKKVTICHYSTPVKYQTKRVPPRAVGAHLAHGDTLGACSVIHTTDCLGDKCELDVSGLKFGADVKTVSIALRDGGKVTKCYRNDGDASNSDYMFSGVCEGGGDAVLLLLDEQIHGMVSDGSYACSISPDASGRKTISSCTPVEELHDDPEPPEYVVVKQINIPGGRRKLVTDTVDELNSSFQPSYGLKGTDSTRNRNLQEKAVFDIIVFWTNKAEMAKCKDTNPTDPCSPTIQTKRTMEGLIDVAIEQVNSAYDASGINATMQLVLADRHPTGLVETVTSEDTLRQQLNNLQKDLEVNNLRDELGADLVALIADWNFSDTGKGGYAFLWPTFSPDTPADFQVESRALTNVYSISHWDSATKSLTFAHETGHNMNCFHDRPTTQACTDDDHSYYGYRDPDGDFRTIMAYACSNTKCDGGGFNTTDCPRILMYSNNVTTRDGKAVGDAANNCAAQIESVRTEIAGYRNLTSCTDTSDCDHADSDPCKVPSCVNGFCIFRPKCDDPCEECDATGQCIPQVCDDGSGCTTGTCNNGTCEYTPTGGDGCCGNGVCEDGEDAVSCQQDCGGGPNTLEVVRNSDDFLWVFEGIMFDMEATLYNLEINSFSFFYYNFGAEAEWTAELWTRQGTYVGSEFIADDWTQVTQLNFVAEPTTFHLLDQSMFDIPLPQPVPIRANTRQAFYITLGSEQNMVCRVAGSVQGNTELKLDPGIPRNYRFKDFYLPRDFYQWIGSVSYTKIVDIVCNCEDGYTCDTLTGECYKPCVTDQDCDVAFVCRFERCELVCEILVAFSEFTSADDLREPYDVSAYGDAIAGTDVEVYKAVTGDVGEANKYYFVRLEEDPPVSLGTVGESYNTGNSCIAFGERQTEYLTVTAEDVNAWKADNLIVIVFSPTAEVDITNCDENSAYLVIWYRSYGSCPQFR